MNPSSSSSLHLHAHENEEKPFSLFHSIHEPTSKPWRRPTGAPDKVYVVDPSGFQKLVQKLTGDPKFTTRRLREAAPAPLNCIPKLPVFPLSSQPEYTNTSSQLQPLNSSEPTKSDECSFGSVGMISPSSIYSSPLLSPIFSPSTMASFGITPVL